ncbi:MAG: HAMP domain-containing histidine kinase [Chitinophagaceae bacterium]|nr:MAG: HAMP domain-containing histidine kinase [Chitinophagaceae bacterium]
MEATFVAMQRPFQNTRWLPLLMVLAVACIAAFQVYWLNEAWQRESRSLGRGSNFIFRESVRQLQASKIRLDKFIPDSSANKVMVRAYGSKQITFATDSNIAGMVQMLNERMVRERFADSSRIGRALVLREERIPDSIELTRRRRFKERDRLFQVMFDAETPGDSIRVRDVDSLFGRRMRQQNLTVPFVISRIPPSPNDTLPNRVTVGLRNPITYQVQLGNTVPYLLQKTAGPIILSGFLVLFCALSFWVLYRNVVRQRRLAEIKNEFISNITHELKTPIATVSVAIEALRSFSASMDPAKSKEYLDISANELQRLSLLVDKVLKLSMFEKRSIELKYEDLDMQELVDEVTTSMRLQFERRNATVTVEASGDTRLQGDRLNLVSVLFNLVDNALKYSDGSPQIVIALTETGDRVQLSVSDQGVGVPEEYRKRIFEKFFRVPTGNVHNAKGYGLGLSYVSHVVNRHHGSIRVEPNGANGSRFIITLPKTAE